MFFSLLQTATQILSSSVLNHALLFVNKSSAAFEEIQSAFNGAAEAFRLKVEAKQTISTSSTETHIPLSDPFTSPRVRVFQILFVWVNVDEPRNGRIMEYFRVRDFEAPLIRMVNLTDHVTYHLPSDTLDVKTITTFCRSYLEGKAKVTFTFVQGVTGTFL